MSKLLSRDEFRISTLARNAGVCVVPSCGLESVDAHHILNRNLFTDDSEFGGYFMENGAGLCSTHHLDAERTIITTDSLYEYCGYDRILPMHLDPAYSYDTWGNVVISDYERIAGELFSDEGCQKALSAAGVLWMFA